jgi:hypothetical protein
VGVDDRVDAGARCEGFNGVDWAEGGPRRLPWRPCDFREKMGLEMIHSAVFVLEYCTSDDPRAISL